MPGDACIACSETAMGVQGQSTRPLEMLKTTQKISGEPSIDARTKFRPGLEKVTCNE